MDPYIGEIRAFAGNFAPQGWAFCNGQIMSISQNTALYSLLGTVYGGDGKTTFALPNLQGRTPMHHGSSPGLTTRSLGETGGNASVILTESEMPSHNHLAQCTTTTNLDSPTGAVWSDSGGRRNAKAYNNEPNQTNMSPQALQTVGGNQPHNNRQPYLALNYIIALQGIFPPRS